jgi:rubredoxin
MMLTGFQCTVCGFVYQQDGQAQTPGRLELFSQLPATWRCPHCGVLKNLFKEITSSTANATHNSDGEDNA